MGNIRTKKVYLIFTSRWHRKCNQALLRATERAGLARVQHTVTLQTVQPMMPGPTCLKCSGIKGQAPERSLESKRRRGHCDKPCAAAKPPASRRASRRGGVIPSTPNDPLPPQASGCSGTLCLAARHWRRSSGSTLPARGRSMAAGAIVGSDWLTSRPLAPPEHEPIQSTPT